MNLDAQSFILAQISSLVASLNKKNVKATAAELAHLAAGQEAHLLRCLFSAVELDRPSVASPLLSAELTRLLNRPDFASLVRSALERPLNHRGSNNTGGQYVTVLLKQLKLSSFAELAFAAALLDSPKFRTSAAQFLETRIPSLATSSDFSAQSAETGHWLLTQLTTHCQLVPSFNPERLVALLDTDDSLFSPLKPAPNTSPISSIPKMPMEPNPVGILSEAGPSSTSNVDDCVALLSDCKASLNPIYIGQMLALSVTAAERSGEVLVQAIKRLGPDTDWTEVTKRLDTPTFNIRDRAALSDLITSLRLAFGNAPIPAQLFCVRWKNTTAQLSLLKACLENQDVFFFGTAGLYMAPLDNVRTHYGDDKRMDVETWRCVELVTALQHLAEAGHHHAVLNLLKVPMERCPDVLVTSMLQTRQWSELKRDIFAAAVGIFVAQPGPGFGGAIMNAMWSPGREHESHLRPIIVEAFERFYKTGPSLEERTSRLTMIQNMAQEMKALPILLSMKPNFFLLDLAQLSARRQFLKLDKWLMDRLKEGGNEFLLELVEFIRQRWSPLTQTNYQFNVSPPSALLPKEILPDIAVCLRTYISNPPAPVSSDTNALCVTIITNVRRLTLPSPAGSQLLPSNASGNIGQSLPAPSPSQYGSQATNSMQAMSQPPGLPPRQPSTVHYTKQIESETNALFQTIFRAEDRDRAVQDAMTKLRVARDSPQPEIWSCFCKCLLDEFRFIHNFPPRELNVLSVVFGSVIREDLFNRDQLRMALKFVLESLKRMPAAEAEFQSVRQNERDQKLSEFGRVALEQFMGRGSADVGLFYDHLLATPDIALPMETIHQIKQARGLRSEPAAEPARGDMESPQPTRVSPAVPAVVTEKRPDMVTPPQTVIDKLMFMFNNLSQSNFDDKVEEFKAVCIDEYIPWAATYLVTKRVSVEQNYHQLYFNFVESMDHPRFTEMIISETLRNVKGLLQTTGKKGTNFSERYLIKHLGHWLGLVTFGRNVAPQADEINLSSLLMEAYYKGEVECLYVVPFVVKVLMGTRQSRVFRYPNPLTTRVIKVLIEMHTDPNLKLNLKFEIEVLCRDLGADLRQLGQDFLNNVGHRPFLHNTYIYDQVVTEPVLGPVGRPSEQIQAPTSIPPPPVPRTVTPTPLPPPPTSSGAPPSSMMSRIDVSAAQTNQAAYHQAPFVLNEIMTFKDLLSGPYLRLPDSPLLQGNQGLSRQVLSLIDATVREVYQSTLERLLKPCIFTCEAIIKKDFALDPEEQHLRAGAQHMIKHLVGGWVLVQLRELLAHVLVNRIKDLFTASLPVEQRPKAESEAQRVVSENLDFCLAFCQAKDIEVACNEIEKRLMSEYDMRRMARSEGRHYVNAQTLQFQAERMPDLIRLKVGSVLPAQASVYEELARSIPNFQPSILASDLSRGPGGSIMNTGNAGPLADEVSRIYVELNRTLQSEMTKFQQAQQFGDPRPASSIGLLIEAIGKAIQHKEYAAGTNVIQRVLENICENYRPNMLPPELAQRYVEIHQYVLQQLRQPSLYGASWVNKNVAKAWTDLREDLRTNVDAIIILLKNRLICVNAFDGYLANLLILPPDTSTGLSPELMMRTTFAITLVEKYVLEESSVGDRLFGEAELHQTIDKLRKVSASRPIEKLATLLDHMATGNEAPLFERPPNHNIDMLLSGIAAARDTDDPIGLHEKTEMLLREWTAVYSSKNSDMSRVFSTFINQMHQQGILKSDEVITRFFRITTEICVDLCYHNLSDQSASPIVQRNRCFQTLDAFVHLVVLLLKTSGSQDSQAQAVRANLINKVLGILVGCLLRDQELRNMQFQQLPYHRILQMLWSELCSTSDQEMLQNVIYSFCHAFHYIRPSKAPSFAFAWLELISHRFFLPKVLNPTAKKWCVYYAQLLSDFFHFMAPFLRNMELNKALFIMYKGLLRVMLVLLHDFPEFLISFHHVFYDIIPANCIQLRNVILSAFPRQMSLPDPFRHPTYDTHNHNLKQDMQKDPIMYGNPGALLPADFKKSLDLFLDHGAPVDALTDAVNIVKTTDDSDNRYQVQMINALVLYIGTQAIQALRNDNQRIDLNAVYRQRHMNIHTALCMQLDTEGRYLLFSAMANQLRYPNSHTNYFHCVLLKLYSELQRLDIQEQIARIFLERLIVSRPHPWGLLITFIELMKNPIYDLQGKEFVHCCLETERLFDSLAKTCLITTQPQPLQQQQQQRAVTAS